MFFMNKLTIHSGHLKNSVCGVGIYDKQGIVSILLIWIWNMEKFNIENE